MATELKSAWELEQKLWAEDCKLSNELVRQKDELLRLVDVGTVEAYSRALTCLEFVAPLWAQAEYVYKVREVKARVQQSLEHDLEHATAKLPRAQLTALLERCR